ncbi:hypothetical protein JS533_007460 [Bifidobacterium amazonense]|uniref:Uncharacterized protein n=1 Tax=Bifidobacterium amazonense TaxID=2809027 RepID=A0ABS9VVX7_9BIFI|nr:hypothetical protein [Bifidobacterium amazonense]MCH9276109.1 hypothetical protein [Bifidobacterium amazonense]
MSTIPQIPHTITIDAHQHKVLIDGLPFTYPLASIGPRPQFEPGGAGIVWLPLLADHCEYKADIQANSERRS